MTMENGMALVTKDDERKALEAIRKIVEGLGEKSYVGTAFEGVFELAEQNINDDAGYSAEDWKKAMRKSSEELKEAQKQIAELKSSNASLLLDLNISQERYADLCDMNKEILEKSNSLNIENSQLQDKVIEKDFELLKLKAKLYDLMEGKQ